MEHRHDLEQILLNGLPEDERRQTIDSMTEATAAKLAHLRSTTWQSTSDIAESSGRPLRSRPF
jgi:hypothetical protein